MSPGASARRQGRRRVPVRAVAAGIGLILGALAAAAAPARPRLADLDLLWRARVIAVAGAPASVSDPANELTVTARALAAELSASGRARVAAAGKVASAMEELQLRGPRDLLVRNSRGQVKLDMEKSVALARRAGADSLLIPFWESVTKGDGPDAPAIPRLHALLVLVERREIIWEDAEPARRQGTAPPEPSEREAEIRATARTLARSFLADLRRASERG